MATTDIASSSPASELSAPPPTLHGQGMSKAARISRSRAAKKAALLKNLDTATPSAYQAVSPKSADATKVMSDQDEELSVETISITNTNPSVSASIPKEPLSVKISLPPAASPKVNPKPTTPSVSPASNVTDVPPQPKVSLQKSGQLSPPCVVHQGFDNLLEMIRQQRQALLQGPRITIHIGDTSVENISKRAAMAASSVLHKHFSVNPELVEYRFSRGQIHPGAVRLLLIGWMQETCNEFEAYAVAAQKTFGEDLAILRAARLLGMERYCRHLLAGYVEYLKTELPSYEEILAVEQNATSDKDPLWTTMVNHLCHDRFKGLIPDMEDFEAFLEQHTRLKKAMESADIFFAGYARKQAEGREKDRRQRWEQNQAEKHECITKERLAAESLKKKMDEKGSRLMTVTAEEAELLRGRTRTR